jgi:NAD(P)-dependent dehydrogenase (short-subunit alcohol dehydrogenase family)
MNSLFQKWEIRAKAAFFLVASVLLSVSPAFAEKANQQVLGANQRGVPIYEMARCHKCKHESRHTKSCRKLEQPPSPEDPQLSLEGENCMCCYLSKKMLTNPHNLNSNVECFKYKKLCKFLAKPVNFPAIDASKLFYTPNPPLNVPSCQKVVYPPEVPVDQQLDPIGKVVLIIGGAKGLGKATAEFLSQNGFTVIATSSHPDCYDPLPSTANYTLSKVPLDIRSDESVKKFFDKVIKPIGKLNVMINFAGVHWVGPMSGATSKDYENCLQLKVIGSHRCVINALPYLRVEPNSRVISLSSVAGGENYISLFQGGYNVSNHALCMWNDSFMSEERMLYATNAITNPVTFTVVEPQIILSTIGLYEDYVPSKPIDKIYTTAPHIFVAAFQAGVADILGIDADPQLFVAQQIFSILVAPQPGVRYILGNPTTTVPTGAGPLTWAQVLQLTNTISQDDTINAILAPLQAIYSTPVLNVLRQRLQDLYCNGENRIGQSQVENKRIPATIPPFYFPIAKKDCKDN